MLLLALLLLLLLYITQPFEVRQPTRAFAV
jgi:hypothetical protein